MSKSCRKVTVLPVRLHTHVCLYELKLTWLSFKGFTQAAQKASIGACWSLECQGQARLLGCSS